MELRWKFDVMPGRACRLGQSLAGQSSTNHKHVSFASKTEVHKDNASGKLHQRTVRRNRRK